MPDWNEKQQEVLDSLADHRDILVSAAAGSGKTAVLVQRIIDTVDPVMHDRAVRARQVEEAQFVDPALVTGNADLIHA